MLRFTVFLNVCAAALICASACTNYSFADDAKTARSFVERVSALCDEIDIYDRGTCDHLGLYPSSGLYLVL